MGWSWAPVIAHSISQILLRRMTAAFRTAGVNIVASCVYIDNMIVALQDQADTEPILTIMKEVCANAGAVIKPSSIETGTSVDWRGLTLDATEHRYRLKDAFVNKIRAAWNEAKEVRGHPRLSWSAAIPLLSCIIYATYARDYPLGTIVSTMRWVVRLSSLLEKDAARITTTTLTFPAAVAADIDRTISSAPDWSSLRLCITQKARAFGQSDAAGAEDRTALAAYAYHAPTEMRLKVWQPSATADIFQREFDAMMSGMRSADPAGIFQWTWITDNTRSLHQLRKTWAAEWHVNEALLWFHGGAARVSESASIAYTPSRLMLMDAFTRAGEPREETAAACTVEGHAGTDCAEFDAWIRSFVPHQIPEVAQRLRAIRFSMLDERVRFEADSVPSSLRTVERKGPPLGGEQTGLKSAVGQVKRGGQAAGPAGEIAEAVGESISKVGVSSSPAGADGTGAGGGQPTL
jgi:hypothetical protein